LHEELRGASTSRMRKHEIVVGAYHHIHWTHPEAVIDAAREMILQIKSHVP
jgi:hypothetical protein